MSKDRALPDSAVRLAGLDDRLVFQVGGLHIACSVGDTLVVLGCLITLAEAAIRENPGNLAAGLDGVARAIRAVWTDY